LCFDGGDPHQLMGGADVLAVEDQNRSPGHSLYDRD
jgi:hypothetical protein